MVAARTSAGDRRRDQVRLRMADDCQFGPATVATTGIAAAVVEVNANVVGLQAGGVDGPFGLVLDQAALNRPLKDDAQEPVESPFFTSRFWA